MYYHVVLPTDFAMVTKTVFGAEASDPREALAKAVNNLLPGEVLHAPSSERPWVVKDADTKVDLLKVIGSYQIGDIMVKLTKRLQPCFLVG